MSRRGTFRDCEASDAADAGCIGKSGNEAVAESTRRIAPRPFWVRLLAQEAR